MYVGSLFSGIGGLELGFAREGFKTRWFVENNPYCQEVLKEHFPGATIYGDIRQLDFSSLAKVDILTGGFPCQDISVAGKRKGLKDGKRSSLWKYYAQAIGVLRPQVAVIENVPNLVNLGLDVVLADLAQAGYNAEWFNLRASDFGAPHKRERIFIIAYQQGDNSNAYSKREQGANQGFDKTKQEKGQSQSELSGHAACPLTDDWSDKLQAFAQESLQGKQGFKSWQDIGSVEELFNRSDIPKPLIRRGDDGLPRKLGIYLHKARIQAIGNAVVPQVAQFIARRLKEVTC